MFKKILALVVLASVSTVAFAQGTVNFATAALGTSAQVKTALGGLATGSAYMAQLYAAPGSGAAESALVPVGVPVGFRTGINAGYVLQSGTNPFGGSAVNPVVTIDAAAAGGPVTVQLRAWDAAFSSYSAALTANAELGKSALLSLSATGNPVGSPPTTPVALTGLTGFTMVVPEPSTLALVLLGGAALLIRRRK